MFTRLNLSDARRVFVVGDIHGCFTRLEDELDKLNFDTAEDHLLSVGDLVDRGPESERAIEFLNHPWFHAVRGNHEQMVIEAGGTSWHTGNGGKWFSKLKYTTRDVPNQGAFIQAFKALPIAMEVQTPTQKIGLVHACFPWEDWNLIEQYIFHDEEHPIWDRYVMADLVRRQRMAEDLGTDFEAPVVKNIDAIYHGHTPIKQPISVGNRHYIDTGAAYAHAGYGNFTIVEVT